MKIISAEQIAELAPYGELVEVLRAAFQSDIQAPERHVHTIERAGEANASFLLMPAWDDISQSDVSHDLSQQKYAGLKTVIVLPDNAKRGAPSVQANYLLYSGLNGDTLAVLDGNELTLRRTACASALASDYLSKPDASTLLMVGAGALSPHLVRAHASVRPIDNVIVYNRNYDKAVTLAKLLEQDGLNASATRDIEQSAKQADIISCATTSCEPIIHGAWLQKGVHVDLVGAFKPDMRETDGEAIARADVFVDTRGGAMSEAGDLLQAVQENKFSTSDIKADLFDLTAKRHHGRENDDQITLFKSCGTALEDLAAASFIYQKSSSRT